MQLQTRLQLPASYVQDRATLTRAFPARGKIPALCKALQFPLPPSGRDADKPLRFQEAERNTEAVSPLSWSIAAARLQLPFKKK